MPRVCARMSPVSQAGEGKGAREARSRVDKRGDVAPLSGVDRFESDTKRGDREWARKVRSGRVDARRQEHTARATSSQAHAHTPLFLTFFRSSFSSRSSGAPSLMVRMSWSREDSSSFHHPTRRYLQHSEDAPYEWPVATDGPA